MNILCTIDEKYVQHCAAMLTSLFENNISVKFNIYLFTESITNLSQIKLIQLVEKYGSVLNVKIVNGDSLKDFPLQNYKGSRYSLATYYRLLLQGLLPNDIDKILYLDSDLLVRQNIEELWQLDIDAYALAAIDDAYTTAIEGCKRLNICSRFSYFNAGVLLVNLKFWRENDIQDKLVKFVDTNRTALLLQDQDALNAVLHKYRLVLSLKWNMLECFYRDEKMLTNCQRNDMLKWKNNPGIIHWAEGVKPWMYGSRNPFKSEYYKYLQYTFWNDYKPSLRMLFHHFGYKKALFIWLRLDWLYKYVAFLKRTCRY